MKGNAYPVSLLVLIIIIAILNWLAVTFSLYWRISWFDMPMHFLGGVWVSATTLWFFVFSGKFTIKDKYKIISFIYIFAISSVVVIGGVWELFEFGVDMTIISIAQNNLIDTASDMTFNILGAFTVASYFILKGNKKF